MKRMKALVLAACMLLGVMLFAACGNDAQGDNSGTDAVYKVKVVDNFGNPYTSGVIVRFLQGTEQAAMQKVDENGVAEKTLAKGEYTVELMFTDNADKYRYETEGLTLTGDKTELEIVLYLAAATESQTISAQGKEYEAFRVSTGSTVVNLTTGDRSYFLFTPTEAGTYQFSVEGEGLQLGYYGATHFVQENNVATDLQNNVFTQSISADMIGADGSGTSVLVLGIDSQAATECVLNIERIGDPAWTLSDEPWTEYVCKNEVKPFTLDIQEGQKLTYVDIRGNTDDYKVVLNETDGYYHLNTADGPIIYLNLGKHAPNVSLQVVIMGDGAAGGAPIRHYFYDENGEFVKKEDYTDILTKYFDNMDKDYQVYPLNQDLEYIIKNGCAGWWTSSDPNYIFEGCNPELGWLFACCYIEG